MAKNPEFYGKLVEFDAENVRIVFDLFFLDEDQLELITKLLENPKSYRLEIKEKVLEDGQRANWEQQKKWFMDLYKVIEKEMIEDGTFGKMPNSEVSKLVTMFHHQIKYQYFPVSLLRVGHIEIPVVPKLRELSHTEFRDIIAKFEFDFSQSPYEIDFEQRV